MPRPPEALFTWLALMRAHAALVDAIEQDVSATTRIPLAWSEVLQRLSSAPEGQLRMQDLSRSVLLSRSGLTRLADKMEEAGLIERAACPTDRRGTYARITSTGRDVFERGRPAFFRALSEHLASHLSAAEQHQLRSALDKLTEANRRTGSRMV